MSLLGVVMLIVIGVFATGMRQGYEQTLRQLAQPWGWSYERTRGRGLQSGVGVGHLLRGWVDGRAFELVVAPQGGSKYLSEHWTIYLAGALPGGFAAGKNGLLRGTSAGMTKIASGDAEFDKRVLCEGYDPAQAWLVIAAEPRKAVLRELAAMNAVVFGDKILFSKTGFDTQLVKLQQRLDQLRRFAAVLDPVQPQIPYQPPMGYAPPP